MKVHLLVRCSLAIGSLLLASVYPDSMFPLACLLALASVRTEKTLVSVFFLLTAVHCILGYFLAVQSNEHIFFVFGHHRFWFAQAAFTVSLGLLGMSIGYDLSPHSGTVWVNSLSIDEDLLRKSSTTVVIFACGTLLYVYWRVYRDGMLLATVIAPDELKVLGVQNAAGVWIAGKALDLLTYSLPLLWIIRKRKIDYLILLPAILVFLLPLRRAPILSALLVPLIAKFERVTVRRLAIVVIICGALYSSSQIIFLGSAKGSTTAALASSFPEIRDLGWVMAISKDKYLYGSTLIQPFDPLPVFASDWKRRHTMQYITSDLLGYDPDASSFAGLRLTIAGEGFMNFGLLGPPLLGLLLGIGISWCERALKCSNTLATRYLGATMFAWVSFWLYLGGTQALGSVKIGASLLLTIYFVSRSKLPARSCGRSTIAHA